MNKLNHSIPAMIINRKSKSYTFSGPTEKYLFDIESKIIELQNKEIEEQKRLNAKLRNEKNDFAVYVLDNVKALKERYESEIMKIKANHEGELMKMEAKHEKEIKSLNDVAVHFGEIMRENQKNKIWEMEAKHEKEIRSLNDIAVHFGEIMRENQKNKIWEMEAKHEKEIESLNDVALHFVENLQK